MIVNSWFGLISNIADILLDCILTMNMILIIRWLLLKKLASFQQQIASGFDMEKVKTTIKQFYRDWSAEVDCHDN